MKKRLLSLLLAVAMMVAILPTAAFADDETGTASNKTLSITADGKPDVTEIVPTIDNGKKVYTGDGWKYEIHPKNNNQDYLYIDNQDYLYIDKECSFDLTNEPAVKCYRVENYGEIQGGVFDPCNWVDSLGVHPGYVENFGTISGGVYNGAVRFAKGNGQISDPEIKGGIFCGDVVYGRNYNNPDDPDDPDDTSYTTFGTISGGIFANDPGVTEKHTIHVINHGRITKLKVGSKEEVAMDTENLYIVGTLDSDLKLTLDDGTVYTVTSVMVNHGSYTQLEKPVPLVITSDGMPDISNMTEGLFGSYVSDDWLYVPSEQTLCLKSGFKGSVGPNPVKCQVENAGIITGGVFYGMVSSAFDAAGTIQGGIFLGTVAANQKIEGGVFVHDQVNGVHTVSSPAELGKIKTITLGNDTVTLDEPVDSFHFGGQPTNLSVTLEDDTVYHIDPSKEADGTVTLEPKPEEPDYYTVIVEGGEARNERGDILDSEVALTAGEKITLKLLDETQGEMVFSHWDVNNNDTDLADELAKKGFDKTAHETTFTMPAHNLTLTAKYRMPDEDAPQDDSFLMTAAAVTGGAVLTGLVVWQGYNIFSQVYLNAHLPEGTAIPTNRQQLALLLWNTAGQPEASAASYVFPDVADPDVQTAARWATEQGLFKTRKDGTFAPTDSVTTGQVYRAWQKVK